MQGYPVSQGQATKAASEANLEIWISPTAGYFIRSDTFNDEVVLRYVRSPIKYQEIPKNAFLAKMGVHIAPPEVTIAELSEIMGLSYNSLVKAAREGRLEARRSASVWLSTEDNVKRAISEGKLRPRK